MKVHLHVIESQRRKAHSIYKDLQAYPPVDYGQQSFTRIGKKTSLLLPVAKRILNTIKLPNMWHIKQPCDLIHSASYLITNKKPWVVDFEMNAGFVGFNTNRLHAPIGRHMIKKYLSSPYCKRILPWSQAAAQSILRYIPSSKIKQKIEVCYPTIIPHKTKKKKKDGKKVKFLFLGRYFLPKGGKETLALFDRLSKQYDIDCTIISDVPPAYKRKYKNNKSIHIHSFIPREILFKDYFPNADIFLMPTHYDTYGLAYLEAMNFSLPIIAANTFAVPEIVQHQKTGLLAQSPKVSWFTKNFQPSYNGTHEANWRSYHQDLLTYKDIQFEQDLYDHAKQLIEDHSLRKRMGQAGYKRFHHIFSIEKRNKQLKEVYERALL